MKLTTTTLIFALLVPSVSNAEYNARKLAEAVGSYLYIVAATEYLQSSKCEYLFKTNYSLDQATRDALLHFRNKDREELKILLQKRKPKIVTEARNMVDGFFAATKKDGIDWKSSCGMLLGIINNNFTQFSDDYENAISRYGK